MTHICVSKLTIIGSDNGLTLGRRQAIIWTNAGILLIGPLGINFSETSIEIHTFSFKKIHLKLSSGKWRPFCLCLNVLTEVWYSYWSRLCTTPFHHNGGSFLANTIGCHHNVVQYIMIFCSVLQWLMQNINQNLYSQIDTPYLALTDELWGVYWENFGENWPRYNCRCTHNRHLLAYLWGWDCGCLLWV